MAGADVVDWELAVSVGHRLAPIGPALSRSETFEAVAELRALAAEAVLPVRECSGLVAEDSSAVTVIADRPTWISSNVAGFQVVLEPLLERLREQRGRNVVTTAVGSRGTALQLGAVLAYLSGKVLGQYEAFDLNPSSPGRLLLVAPNIVATERTLAVVPRDFRLWVCLHEETHRVQFGAVRWLGEHLVSLIHSYLELTGTDAGEVLRRVRAALSGLNSGSEGSGRPTLLAAAQSPEQRAIFDQLTAVMSLLEGHADYVMDEVGPQVVPTVTTIRERFQERRTSPGLVDGIARRLLGLDAKLAQYADGAVFVRGVVDLEGRDGFNQVWAAPANLPSRAEISDPAAWCTRVLNSA